MMNMIKSFLCFINFHNWNYKDEYHTCEGISSHIKDMRLHIRECKWCEKRQQHIALNPNCNDWENIDFKSDEHLTFKRRFKN